MNKSDDDDDEHIYKENYIKKIAATYYNSQKNGYGFEQNLDLHHEICVVVESGGSTASFGRQRVVRGCRSDHLFVKVLNLLFVHLHHNRPLQLHGRACWVQSVSLLDSWFRGHTNGMKRKKKKNLHSPSSPPVMEKSWSRMVHFWMRWALEVDFLLTALIPSWMAVWTARSLPPAISDTRVALLPNFRQNSTASGVSSSSGSPESGFTLHCRGTNSKKKKKT